MMRMMNSATDALWPVFEALERDLKSSSKLYMNESVLAQLDPGSGKTKTCFVWALCRDDRRWKGNSYPGVVFHFKNSRHGKHAEEVLEGFSGTLQVDGYAGYNRLLSEDRDGGPIALAYCWAHVRKKFLDVYKATKSKQAKRISDLIGQIYGIEQEMQKPSPISAAARRSIRQNESLPLIDRLFRILRDLSEKISMKSTLGSAIRYTMKLMDGLQVFLSDGRVEFDSNAVENTIRPIAVLRKAGSEFIGSHKQYVDPQSIETEGAFDFPCILASALGLLPFTQREVAWVAVTLVQISLRQLDYTTGWCLGCYGRFCDAGCGSRI